ncbi:hypothetical protein MPQ_2359 [Methylovorus sp. MP688]|nr:hypothetical protein MPQ_2359 [Methylovorus sp. MP688]
MTKARLRGLLISRHPDSKFGNASTIHIIILEKVDDFHPLPHPR